MYEIFRFTMQAMTLVLTYMLIVLGLDWIELGHGLNPWIAFPIAFVLGYVNVRSIIEDIQHQRMRYQMAKVQRQAKANREFYKRLQEMGIK